MAEQRRVQLAVVVDGRMCGEDCPALMLRHHRAVGLLGCCLMFGGTMSGVPLDASGDSWLRCETCLAIAGEDE